MPPAIYGAGQVVPFRGVDALLSSFSPFILCIDRSLFHLLAHRCTRASTPTRIVRRIVHSPSGHSRSSCTFPLCRERIKV